MKEYNTFSTDTPYHESVSYKSRFDYKYVYEGEEYSGNDRSDTNYAIGDSLTVYVNPNDPSESRCLFGTVLTVCLMILAAIDIGVWIAVFWVGKSRRKAEG